MKIYHIYKITSPSGKIYIGQTRDPETRKKDYKRCVMSGQKLIYNSIKKHGWGNHVFEVIDWTDEANIDAMEIFYIKKFQSNKNEYPDGNGLNLSGGGEGVRGISRGYVALRNKMYTYPGEKNGMFGKKRPDLAERNRLRKLSNETRGENNHKSKSVIDTATGKTYGSVYLAAVDVGINYSTARYYLQNPEKNKSTLRTLL